MQILYDNGERKGFFVFILFHAISSFLYPRKHKMRGSCFQFVYRKRPVVRRGFKNSCFHSSYFVLLLNISNCLLDNYLLIIIYMEIDSGLQVIYWFTNSIFRCKNTLFWFLFYFFHLHLLVVQNKVIQFVP